MYLGRTVKDGLSISVHELKNEENEIRESHSHHSKAFSDVGL